jgi:transcriptional regulator GlxA family with amidase domain
MSEHTVSPKPSLESRIQKAEDIALQSLALPFGVQEFAEAAGLSRSRFSVAYQAHRGVSAGCFLRKRRMERAIELLSDTEEPIAKVGAMVGYPEPTGFGRAFRRHTGLSPSRWRRTVRKTALQTAPESVPAQSTPEPRESQIVERGPASVVRLTSPTVPSDLIEMHG